MKLLPARDEIDLRRPLRDRERRESRAFRWRLSVRRRRARVSGILVARALGVDLFHKVVGCTLAAVPLGNARDVRRVRRSVQHVTVTGRSASDDVR
eukprot:810250-Rhodomonas_salina.3